MPGEKQVRSRRQGSTAQHTEQHGPARLVVPLALALCLLLVLVTFATAGKPSGDEQDSSPVAAKSDQERDQKSDGDAAKPPSEDTASDSGDKEATGETGPALYKVKPGDSFGAIADKTGIEISELADLNPDVDPRALQPGQQLKLR